MLNIHIIGLGSEFKGKRILPLNLKPQISYHRKLPFAKTKAFCWIFLYDIALFILKLLISLYWFVKLFSYHLVLF